MIKFGSEAADKLIIGDYILKINNVPTLNLSYEQAIGVSHAS